MEKGEVLVVDGSQLFREALVICLELSPFTVADQARDLSEALFLISEGSYPEVILFDFEEAETSSEDIVSELRRRLPETKLLLFTAEPSPNKLVRALNMGIEGCVLRTVSGDILIKSLELVCMDVSVFPASLVPALLAYPPQGPSAAASPQDLSSREREILRFIVSGYQNRKISKHLGISEGTVKSCLNGILKKIDRANRTQAATWAFQNGIMPITEEEDGPRLNASPGSGNGSFNGGGISAADTHGDEPKGVILPRQV